MKRMRTLLLAVCMVAMSAMLCSCNYLDELKQSRVTVLEDGSLSAGGHVYTLAGTDPNSWGWTSGETLIMAGDDVPLLLGNSFGRHLLVSWDDYVVTLDGLLYARDDMPAAARATLSPVRFDHYALNGDWVFTDDGSYKYVGPWMIDDALTEAIDAILDGQSIEGMPYDDPSRAGVAIVYSESFWKTDARAYFFFWDGDFEFQEFDNGELFLIDYYEYRYFEVPERYRLIVDAFIQDKGSHAAVLVE